MFNKLKQFRELRSQAKGLQNVLKQEKVEIEKAGIKIVMDGSQEILSVNLPTELLSPEKKSDLENKLKDAYNSAADKAKKVMAQKMQKMGGFVPGVRPGASTAGHISYILNRVLLIGALFLGTVAVMPFLVQKVTHVTAFQFLLGGTALLIMVSVALETMRQIRAQLQMRDYDTF